MLKNGKEKMYNLLRWSEQYTKTDMVYLAKGGAWLTTGQIFASASAFLLSTAFANLLPKETYGIYRYILSIAGILSIFALPGMGVAIIQATARGYGGSFLPAIKAKIQWGLLGAGVGVATAGYYFFQENNTLAISILIASIFLPIIETFGLYDALLQGKKRFDISTKYFIVSQIISVTILIAVLFSTNNIFAILLAYFAPLAITKLIFFRKTIQKTEPETKQDSQTIFYGKHLSLINVISTIANYIDRLLIFNFLGATEVAIYSFAIAPPEQIKNAFKNVHTLALPRFSGRTKEELKATIKEKSFMMILVIGLIVIGYIIAAPFLYRLFFPQYTEAVFYSQLFAISLITAAATLPYSALEAQKASHELYIHNTLSSIIEILLLFVLIYFYGILGAVIARVITRFIGWGLSYWLLKKI